jgi:hypothetical protein
MTLALRQCAALTRRGRRCRNSPSGHHDRCGTHLAPARAITASVAEVNLDDASWQTWRAGDRDWQREAWRLYDIIGELRFVANRYAANISRCRLYVAEIDENGDATKETKNRKIAVLAAGPLGQGSAKDEALRLLGINLFVAGEAFIVAEADALEGGGDRWFVVSSGEISRIGDTITIRRSQLTGGDTRDMVYRPGVDLILRVWTPHPRRVNEPDSPTRSAIPSLRAIEAIWKRLFAELDSRLSGAGLLLMSQNFDFPRGDDDQPGLKGFQQLLTRAMSTALQDRSSAAAMVPIMATAPPDEIDKIKHLTFWSDLSDQLLPLMEAAIKSLARSLDAPAEILLGLTDVNHWSGWLVTEQEVGTHIAPSLARIADALSQGYLWGALEEIGQDPDNYLYAFDHSVLVARPDRTADALNYYQAGLISEAAAVEMAGIREDQAPTDEERLRALATKLLLAAPQLIDNPMIRELVGFPEPEPAEATAGTPTEEPAAEPREPEEAETPNGPPERPAPEDEDTEANPPVRTAAAVNGAPMHLDHNRRWETDEKDPTRRTRAALGPVASLATVRALSVAGVRLVPRQQRDQYAGVARHELHTRVGPVAVDVATKALRGAWDDLPTVAAELDVDPAALRDGLHGHAMALLTSGRPYDADGLRQVTAEMAASRPLVMAA